jgi:putative ABC transport system substrate-binding protein
MPGGRTDRRAFIAGLGSAATLVCSKRSFGQTIGHTPRVAVVGFEADPKNIAAFAQGMRETGWIKDINVRFDYHWVGTKRTTTVATEVVGSNPTIIVTIGSPVTVAMHSASATIPIVFSVVSDPIGQGIVTDLAHPGGNITGFSHFDRDIGGKWLQLLHEITPQTMRFASMFNPAMGSYTELFQRSIEDAARSLSLEVTRAPVRNDGEIEAAFERLAGTTNIALLVPSDQFTYLRSAMIAALAAKYRVPAIYPGRRFVDYGGLVAYSPDLYDEIHRSASYVDRILKGEKPADLPVQAPTKFELVINLKAAKSLGLKIPESILARADEVIE